MSKRVRMLLRVSSNQQLEADGDLSVQRDLDVEYVKRHGDWVLDSSKPEYFEGSNSGYSNAVADRDILQEIYEDACHGEFDILVTYKDDRVGRRLWEIGGYVMQLKSQNVEIWTVKDGCISPETDDVMGQITLALRYGNAQKSSSDTGMRVKDTAQKLVQKGKFMGGKAPFGYRLSYSGEISKHGRALKHLKVVPEEAEVVKEIYKMSYYKSYGCTRIAKVLNEDEKYKQLAPHDFWKAGTIRSILTNPVYTGYIAYNRREKNNGKYRTIGKKDWIYAEKENPDIKIIDKDFWNAVQEKKSERSIKYICSAANVQDKDKIIRNNSGNAPLVDVLHCGYCGAKLTVSSKYDYWTLKSGEKRSTRRNIYVCHAGKQGVPHNGKMQYFAAEIETLVFQKLSDYIDEIQKDSNIYEAIKNNNAKERQRLLRELQKFQKEAEQQEEKINLMTDKLADAVAGTYPLSVDTLVDLIDREKIKLQEYQNKCDKKKKEIQQIEVSVSDLTSLYESIPTWKDVFYNADGATKRVLVDKIIDRIDIRKETIIIKFKIDLGGHRFLPREYGYHDVPE